MGFPKRFSPQEGSKKVYIPPPIDPDFLIWADECTAQGDPVTEPWYSRINNAFIELKAQGQFTKLDFYYPQGLPSRVWAGISYINPTVRQQIYQNAYAGDFTASRGFNGDGTGFGIQANFNPFSAGGNYTQDSATIGVFFLKFNTGDVSHHDVSSFAPGYASGENAWFKHIGGINFASRVTLINAGGLAQTTSYDRLVASGYCWVQSSRTDSGTTKEYCNGVWMRTITNASVALKNTDIGLFGAYNNAWTAGFYTNSQAAGFYGGAGDLDAAKIMGIMNYYVHQYLGTKAAIQRVSFFMGDSMSGSYLGADKSTYGYINYTLADTLGDGYPVVTSSLSSRYLQQMVIDYPTQVQPYKNAYIDMDLLLWGGTNDIALGGRTGAQVYADAIALLQMADADGWRRITFTGMPDRQGTFGGGVTQAFFDTERAAFNALMNAEFNQPTSVANVYTSLNYPGYWLNVSSDAKFNNAANATYFMADLVHPTPALIDVLLTNFLIPTLNI